MGIIGKLFGKGPKKSSAASADSMEMGSMLISGAMQAINRENVNFRGPDGNTILHLSANAGNLPVVQALIGKGADINVQNEAGLTPLQIAVRKGYPAIADLLRKNGAKD